MTKRKKKKGSETVPCTQRFTSWLRSPMSLITSQRYTPESLRSSGRVKAKLLFETSTPSGITPSNLSKKSQHDKKYMYIFMFRAVLLMLYLSMTWCHWSVGAAGRWWRSHGYNCDRLSQFHEEKKISTLAGNFKVRKSIGRRSLALLNGMKSCFFFESQMMTKSCQ